MKFSPKVVITGIDQDLFDTLRLCEAICSNYHVDIFINYMNAKNGQFAISTRNMRFNQWYIYEDLVKFLGNDYVVEDNFSETEKNMHISVKRSRNA